MSDPPPTHQRMWHLAHPRSVGLPTPEKVHLQLDRIARPKKRKSIKACCGVADKWRVCTKLNKGRNGSNTGGDGAFAPVVQALDRCAFPFFASFDDDPILCTFSTSILSHSATVVTDILPTHHV